MATMTAVPLAPKGTGPASSKFSTLTFTNYHEREDRWRLQVELSCGLKDGAFRVEYQPLCLPDGTLKGFEALLRFNSQRLGNVPPSCFIPFAEEANLIVEIGEWVLREVCRQSREWAESGNAVVPISVNISSSQFARDDFADTVAKILRESGMLGTNLVLELTESIVMQGFAETSRQMERLRRLGVRIAIDDFGTGYSSLCYLHRLPIDVLKIDRSFIHSMNEPHGSLPIVEAVVLMAHALGLQVVAEGVETAEQLMTLRQRGCDVIQGYFFSRPVQAKMAAAFLKPKKLQRGNHPVSRLSPTVHAAQPEFATIY